MGYIETSLSKQRQTEARAENALTGRRHHPTDETLTHGKWIAEVRAGLEKRRFRHPLFALLVVLGVLYVGSLILLSNLTIPSIEAPDQGWVKAIEGLFAATLGFILAVWWEATNPYDARLREAERLDREYRALLISFSDSLFDIINALNTLATKPSKPFVVASEFLLGEYIHHLQSQLQRYGDYIAGLGFDATDFLNEKIRIFEGIRERASVSVQGMPKEIESLFVDSLSLHEPVHSEAAMRQQQLRAKLQELSEEPETEREPIPIS